MSGTRNPVTEAELHAWLDGELPEERLADVERHLADNPEIAQRFERYRAQRSLLGQSFGPLIDQPLLPVSIDAVAAAGSVGESQPYPIQFTCSLADNKAQLTDGLLYHRGTELIVVPVLEKLSSGLLARNRDSTVVLTVPAGTLKPGKYTVTLIGARASRRWTLQVH